MRMLVAAVLAVAIGCGGEDSDPLLGDWIIEFPAQNCATAASFKAGSRYTLALLCNLDNGSVGAQAEEGHHETSGNSLTTFPEKATCADRLPETVTYSASASSLTITDSVGVLILKRNTATGGSGSVIYGCSTADGFVPSPLAPI